MTIRLRIAAPELKRVPYTPTFGSDIRVMV